MMSAPVETRLHDEDMKLALIAPQRNRLEGDVNTIYKPAEGP